MCDHLPPTEDPPENYYVDNVQTTVGEIVTVFCKNVTVAVIQCMPDLKWNATVPACATNKPQNTMATLLIIVWAVGAILLVALIVLIVLIVSYRSKNGCRSRGNSSSTSSVFHISGGRREGGDNLAFSRADERCGEWSFHRAAEFRDTTRLPSYQEAILNNYITVPAAAGNLSPHERPNFIRANAPPSYRSSQHQSVSPDGITSSPSEPQVPTAEETLRPSTETTVRTRQETSSSSHQNTPVSSRYAENYPQCFFQEEPPPPYTPGPTNYNIYRSPVRQSHPQRGGYNRRGVRAAYSPPNDSVHSSNNRRSTRESSRSVHTQNELSTNPVLEQANHDLLQSNQNTASFPHHLVPSQSDSGYQSLMTNLMPTNSSASNSSQNQCCLNQSNSLTCQRSSVPKRDNSNCFPSVMLANERLGNERINDSNNEISQRETLYIVQNSQATPTAPIYPLSSQLFQFDGQPIGTSTPLTQSPLVARRFFPDNHPTPQPISHLHQPLPTSHPQHSLPQQKPYIFYTGSRSQHVGQSQTVSTIDPMFSQFSTHLRDGSAPIARLDVDYF